MIVNRRLKTIFALLVMAAGVALAGSAHADPAEDFEAANALFREQHYGRAWEAYQRLIDQGIHNPVLYYNTGCALAGMKANGRAAAMFERALKLDPRFEEARHNLRLVRPDARSHQTALILVPVEWLFSRFTADEFFRVMIGLYWLATLGAVAWLLHGGRLRRVLGAFALLMALGAVLTLPFFLARHEREQWVEAVALSEHTVSRSGPSEKHLEQDILAAGVKVRLLESPRDGWAKIQTPAGRVGYVQREALEIL